MFIERNAESELLRLAKAFPAVTVVGPRQSGKTTLVRHAFPDHAYCNLEHPEHRRLAQQDPQSLFRRFPRPVVFDEVQRAPELLSWILALSDEHPSERGAWILTGSDQSALHQGVSQSLAGRTGILRLLPLTIAELAGAGIRPDRDELICSGFLPRIHADGLVPHKALRDYYQTYVERDLRQLLQLKELARFDVFMRLLAGRVGQLCNHQSLGSDVGVSGTTIAHWLSVLEASYVVFTLRPYFRNTGKRFIKSPKLFFTDVGLAAYLLGLESPLQVSRDPLLGGLFENLVVMEAIKCLVNRGEEPRLLFARDGKGREVDLVFERRGGATLLAEIKAARTWTGETLAGLDRFAAEMDGPTEKAVVYAGDLEAVARGVRLVSFRNAEALFGPPPRD